MTMHIRIRVILLLFIVARVQISSLENTKEPISFLKNDVFSGFFAILNDGLGYDYCTEWDDGRSMGAEFFIKPLPWLYAEIACYGLTWRGNSTSPGSESRIDEIKINAGWSGQWPLWAGRAWAFLGVGTLFHGNFNGYYVQKFWHKGVHVTRTVPPVSSYTHKEVVFTFSGEAGISQIGGFPFSISSSFSLGIQGYFEFASAVAASLTTPYGTARAELQYRGNIARGVSDTSARVLEKEMGLWVKTRFSANFLYVDFSVNPISRISQGSIGMLFGGGLQADQKALFNGHYQIDFTPTLFSQSYLTQIVWSPPEWFSGQSRFGIIVNLHSGWLPLRSSTSRRFQLITTGIEWAIPLGKKVVIEPFAALSIGPVYTKAYVLQGHYRAEIDSVSLGGVLRFSGGVRILPFRLKPEDRRLNIGINAGFVLDVHFGGMSQYHPIARPFIGLSFSDGPVRQ